MQFASGEIPSFVVDRDLLPEVTYDEAHYLIASDMVSYMNILIPGADYNLNSTNFIKKRLQETSDFISPIINSLLYEGYHNFKPPCLCKSDICEPSDNCTAACQFTMDVSQKTMGTGSLDGLKIITTDSFHDVWETNPDHFAHIYNSCTKKELDSGNCVLNISTVTQGAYHTGEDLEIWKIHIDVPELDTAYLPISAYELKTKMISRQNTWTHAGVENVTFEETDGGGVRCGEINQISIDWANSIAGAKTMNRFYNQGYGQPYVIGNDIDVCPAGPCWIWTELQFNTTVDRSKVEVRSPQFSTPLDFSIPSTAGYHYCKVLSPARVIEWIYVDGLREFYSLQSLQN